MDVFVQVASLYFLSCDVVTNDRSKISSQKLYMYGIIIVCGNKNWQGVTKSHSWNYSRDQAASIIGIADGR